MHVLAGDIGGTKTLLLLAQLDGGVKIIAERRFDSRAYPGLLPIVEQFLGSADPESRARPHGACFGIAGPIQDVAAGQFARVTNLPWHVDAAALARALGIKRVSLINDFQAVGYGIEALGADDVAELQGGEEKAHAPRVVLGAGTGLGQGLLVWQTDHYEAIATEGGHVDFAPTDALQTELLRFLLRRFDRVSYERVLSGAGLVNIHAFLCERAGAPPPKTPGDPAATISNAALKGTDPLAVQALDLFVQIYGAQAGNLALTCLARGGVYVAGGIAPKIIKKLGDGTFLRAFRAKGRMAPLLETMPVRVVMNPRVGLLGAAVVAGRL